MKHINFFLQLFLFLNSSVSLAQFEKNIYELNFTLMPTMQSYDLGGAGYTTNAGNVTGTGFGVGFKWNRAEASYSFSGRSETQQVSSPAGITPTTVTSNFQRYLFMIEPNQNANGFSYRSSTVKYNYGLDIRLRSSSLTSPNIYLPERNSVGFRFGADYELELSQQTFLGIGGGISLPLYFDERTSKTGYYRFSLNPDVSILVRRKLWKTLEISSGISVLYEKTFYSGTGERGTTNGVDTYLNIQIPIELRFQF